MLPCLCDTPIQRVVVLLVSFYIFEFAEPSVMKKFSLEKTLIRIAGIALVLFVAAFIIFYDRYDLFRLPFDSGVWGTASDWMMVAVTTITAVFLIKTFREQKRLTKIEQQRYLDYIHPELVYSYELDRDSITFEFEKNTAFNFAFIEPSSRVKADEALKKGHFKIMNVVHVGNPWVLKVNREGISERDSVTFYAFYSDKLNNHFKLMIIVHNFRAILWNKDRLAQLPYEVRDDPNTSSHYRHE